MKTFMQHLTEKYLVEPGIEDLVRFMAGRAKHTNVVALTSNHDRHLTRWLDEANPRQDPLNARYYYELMAARLRHAEHMHEDANMFEVACRKVDSDGIDDVKFLREDESYKVEGIECGSHGDRGLSGSRGTSAMHGKLGHRYNIGHSHSPGIWGGTYVAGTTGTLNPDFAKGTYQLGTCPHRDLPRRETDHRLAQRRQVFRHTESG